MTAFSVDSEQSAKFDSSYSRKHPKATSTCFSRSIAFAQSSAVALGCQAESSCFDRPAKSLALGRET
jgi:hypothetical protein